MLNVAGTPTPSAREAATIQARKAASLRMTGARAVRMVWASTTANAQRSLKRKSRLQPRRIIHSPNTIAVTLVINAR